jgi:L-amino acid N-acyltransferase YncA
MARIDYVFGDRGAAAEAALDACLEALSRDGIRHVSARIDGADNETANLLESRGFRLLGGGLVYTARPLKERPRRVRTIGRIRPFDNNDAEQLVAIAEQAFANYRGRFNMDSNLPRDRADVFYGEWARRCVTHEMADTIFVAEAPDRRLLGFVAFRRREPASTRSGIPIFGNGLAACRPDCPGVYPGLLHHTVAWIHDRGGVAEAQTQAHNAAAIAVHEAVGMRLRQSYHDFSGWLA